MQAQKKCIAILSEPGRMPKRRSTIHEHYDNVVEDSSTPGVISAQCVVCKTRIRASKHVSSNFIKHLRLRHPELYSEYKNNHGNRSKSCNEYKVNTSSRLKTSNDCKSNSNSRTSSKPIRSCENAFDQKVLTFIIDSATPPSVVDKVSFRDMFEETHLQVPNHAKLIQLMEKRYSQMVTYIKNAIIRNEYVCTTADIWSTKYCSFFGYTCHWLDEKMQRKSMALACKRFSGEQSYLRILDVIREVNDEFDLSTDKIVAITTDNVYNFVKLFREFGVDCTRTVNKSESIEYDDIEDYPEPVELPSNAYILSKCIQSASYLLNLLASVDFIDTIAADKFLKEKHTKIFIKCSTLWRKCQHPKSTELIESVLSSSLVCPVVTRWNSIYDAISSLLSHKDNLDELCCKLGIEIGFTTSDLQYLKDYRILMAPIADTIEFLQKEENLVLGRLLPSLVSLAVKLKKATSLITTEELKWAATEMGTKLRQRFSSYFTLSEDVNYAIIAAVLCPNMKLRWFDPLFKLSTHDRTVGDIHRIVIDEAIQHTQTIDNDQDLASQSPQCKEDDFFSFDDTEDDYEPKFNASALQDPLRVTEDVQAIFFKYLDDQDTNIEMLEKYPTLHALAIKTNTPLTSSAPVEQLISFAGTVNDSGRHNFNDFSFEKSVLLKANYGIF